MTLENSLWQIVEEQAIFEPITKINQYEHGSFMCFDTFSDDEDGTFPRVGYYTRLANKIDNEGASAYLNWAGKSKLKFNNGYVKIVRDSKFSDDATILFDQPIKVVIGYLNDEPQIIETNKIIGSFSYEWSWLKNGRQNKIANMCDIYFDCKKYELI